MATWKEDIIDALENLGGVATLSEIYNEVSQIRDEPLPSSYEAIIRRIIEQSSSDSESFNQREDIFFSVNGLGNGIWGLRNFIIENNLEDNEELNNEIPQRRLTTQNRIIRNTALARSIKELVNFQCQLCNIQIQLTNGNYYIEAHHIKPLGHPYHGPDIQNNIIIVCPNCHIKLDYKLIELSMININNHVQNISQEFIDFHNNIYQINISN